MSQIYAFTGPEFLGGIRSFLKLLSCFLPGRSIAVKVSYFRAPYLDIYHSLHYDANTKEKPSVIM